MSDEKQIHIEGVGDVPMDAVLAGLVLAGVDLRELASAPVVDATADACDGTPECREYPGARAPHYVEVVDGVRWVLPVGEPETDQT